MSGPAERYARQTMLPDVGDDGQRLLASASVLVVGAGGLAAPVLPLLAGAGVGKIVIVDPDSVDLSNLHRQTLFRESDCGRAKAEVAAACCRNLNGEIIVEARCEALTPANADGLVAAVDLVLDCADSYAASYTLSDVCLDRGTPLISASVLATAGYVGGFCGGAPSLRAVFPEAPDNAANCATAGVLGPVVSLLGSYQAQMALAVLLKLQPSPLGQMVQIDAGAFRHAAFRFDGAPEPASRFAFVDRTDIRAGDVAIELRPETEAPAPARADALRIAPDALAERLDSLPEGDRLVLCCATGLRSWRAAEIAAPRWPGEIVLVAARAS